MLRIADLKYKKKVLLMVGAAFAGILAVSFLSFATLTQVKAVRRHRAQGQSAARHDPLAAYPLVN